MRKILNNISIVSMLCGAMICQSCTKSFDDLNTNPHKPSSVTPAMLATGLIVDHVGSAFNDAAIYYEKRMFWGEQMYTLQYNRFGNGSFDGIMRLTDGQKMVEQSVGEYKNAYEGLYYYLKGYEFYRATMDMGDIPYSQALQSNEFLYPVYDAQKDVFKGILEDLEKAEGFFKIATTNIEGDPFYNGDVKKWLKATNALRLKVLMSLQKRADDTPDLDIKNAFAKIVQDGNLFNSIEDDMILVYSDNAGQRNPLHKDLTRSVEVYAGSKTMIDPLKEYNDYRLFHFFAPRAAMVDPILLPEGETLLMPNDWKAFEGIDISTPFDNGSTLVAAQLHCRPNDIYRLTYTGVPSMRLGYSDQCFVIAEAIERGWLPGSAKEYYDKGVTSAFEFVKKHIGSEYNQGMNITDEYIANYLQGEKTAYDKGATQLDRLKRIWMQSYLSKYFNHSYDSFDTYRRTGYPEFPVNPLTNLNDAKDRIPVRWLYPSTELNYNKEELEAALQRQWNGAEDVNKVMWVIK